MTVKVTMVPNWQSKIEKNLLVGVLEMATDVHRRSAILAPKDTRALVNSGKIEPIQDGFRVVYGNERVPYARRRHFENKKNPRSLGFLALAGDSVARGNHSKYFRGVL